jgi:hypothetical protein
MSTGAKLVLGVIAVAVVLGIVGVPWWAILLVVVGVPALGYAMLDDGQKRRLRRISRKQIGR